MLSFHTSPMAVPVAFKRIIVNGALVICGNAKAQKCSCVIHGSGLRTLPHIKCGANMQSSPMLI